MCFVCGTARGVLVICYAKGLLVICYSHGILVAAGRNGVQVDGGGSVVVFFIVLCRCRRAGGRGVHKV